MITPELVILVVVFGLVTGSFGNNVITALCNNAAIELGRSKCFCGKQHLKLFELVPVFSFFALKGKCSYCKEKISVRYPIVEISTAFIAVACLYQFGFSMQTMLVYIQLTILLFIGTIDFIRFIIPNILLILLLLVSIAAALVTRQDIFLSAVTALTLSSMLLASNFVAVRTRGGKIIGSGDIKLIFILNMFTPFPLGLFSLWLSAIVALAAMLPLRKYYNRFNGEKRVPFGFFLSTVYGLSLLYADSILFTVQKFFYDTF
ncbi:MAG: prepilin peptidase [Ignavibacteriales bacterium]|nr:prepilin peptidase [Ignavibacteriales bacterium]